MTTAAATLPERGLGDRLGRAFWQHPRLLLALLLTPPLLWLGVVYVGSLAALLVQSFFSIDEFSGVVVPEFTLKTYAELFRPAGAGPFPVVVLVHGGCWTVARTTASWCSAIHARKSNACSGSYAPTATPCIRSTAATNRTCAHGSWRASVPARSVH